ncbi:MAG: GNAT family N-acetyltransferase [Pirellulales bacterium]
MNVLHFRKELHDPPAVVLNDVVRVRTVAIPEDLPAWLALRNRAVAELKPGVRPWTQTDIFSEMIGKPWWNAERSWVVVTDESPAVIVGAVTLAVREGAAARVPVVHWLLVDPAWRRCGIGRLLMAHLERAAGDDGWREVQLETHGEWTAAVAFYSSMGYAPLGEPLPR